MSLFRIVLNSLFHGSACGHVPAQEVRCASSSCRSAAYVSKEYVTELAGSVEPKYQPDTLIFVAVIWAHSVALFGHMI